MKLSIITCTYNGEEYIQQCINSVIDQNLDIDAYEHIFVDAYSIDKTREIIENYQKKYSNVRLIERKPKGVYNAMNEGIKEAKGEYIMCLNSDDWLTKGILNKYLEYVENTGNLDIYYGKVSFTKDKKNYYVPLNSFLKLREFLYFNFGSSVLVTHPSTLSKRELFEGEIGYFDENMKISSDYGFFLKCLNLKKKFCYFPEIVTNFRIHEGSLSTNGANSKLSHKEAWYYKVKYLPGRKAVISHIIDCIAELYGKIFG